MKSPSGEMPQYLMIKAQLQARIQNGALKSGDKLPSERELCALFNTTRITVRESLAQLEASGVIYRADRRGWFVTPERLWLDFIVRDNGPGISRAEQKKIFDPFYTSRNTNTNWGMGLYYVRQIVKSHLGHMQIKSAEGKGSTFIVMLPRYVPGRQKNQGGRDET